MAAAPQLRSTTEMGCLVVVRRPSTAHAPEVFGQCRVWSCLSYLLKATGSGCSSGPFDSIRLHGHMSGHTVLRPGLHDSPDVLAMICKSAIAPKRAEIGSTPPASGRTFCHDVQNYDKGVLVMAVLIEDVFPVGVTIELLDAVTDEMGVDAKLTAGWHRAWHFEKNGRAHGVDVWDSVGKLMSQFVQSTLLPAMGQGGRGQEPLDPSKMGEPEVTITEVHRLVR